MSNSSNSSSSSSFPFRSLLQGPGSPVNGLHSPRETSNNKSSRDHSSLHPGLPSSAKKDGVGGGGVSGGVVGGGGGGGSGAANITNPSSSGPLSPRSDVSSHASTPGSSKPPRESGKSTPPVSKSGTPTGGNVTPGPSSSTAGPLQPLSGPSLPGAPPGSALKPIVKAPPLGGEENSCHRLRVSCGISKPT